MRGSGTNGARSSHFLLEATTESSGAMEPYRMCVQNLGYAGIDRDTVDLACAKLELPCQIEHIATTRVPPIVLRHNFKRALPLST